MNGMKENILKKILELFSQLESEGGKPGMAEKEVEGKDKLEIEVKEESLPEKGL